MTGDATVLHDWRNRTDEWGRDVNGYAICPRCGAMIHQRMVYIHAVMCGRGADDRLPVLDDSAPPDTGREREHG